MFHLTWSVQFAHLARVLLGEQDISLEKSMISLTPVSRGWIPLFNIPTSDGIMEAVNKMVRSVEKTRKKYLQQEFATLCSGKMRSTYLSRLGLRKLMAGNQSCEFPGYYFAASKSLYRHWRERGSFCSVLQSRTSFGQSALDFMFRQNRLF